MYSMLPTWIDVNISIYWYPVLTDDKHKWTKGLLALGSGLKGCSRPQKDPSPFPFGYRCWIITHWYICEKLPKSPNSVRVSGHKTFHLQNCCQLRSPKNKLRDPRKNHGRTTRQGGAPSLPPAPAPPVSQSKYFSLFSNPDSCKNSSIIIILIIIYKNRSFYLFLSFF